MLHAEMAVYVQATNTGTNWTVNPFVLNLSEAAAAAAACCFCLSCDTSLLIFHIPERSKRSQQEREREERERRERESLKCLEEGKGDKNACMWCTVHLVPEEADSLKTWKRKLFNSV